MQLTCRAVLYELKLRRHFEVSFHSILLLSALPFLEPTHSKQSQILETGNGFEVLRPQKGDALLVFGVKEMFFTIFA